MRITFHNPRDDLVYARVGHFKVQFWVLLGKMIDHFAHKRGAVALANC